MFSRACQRTYRLSSSALPKQAKLKRSLLSESNRHLRDGAVSSATCLTLRASKEMRMTLWGNRPVSQHTSRYSRMPTTWRSTVVDLKRTALWQQRASLSFSRSLLRKYMTYSGIILGAQMSYTAGTLPSNCPLKASHKLLRSYNLSSTLLSLSLISGTSLTPRRVQSTFARQLWQNFITLGFWLKRSQAKRAQKTSSASVNWCNHSYFKRKAQNPPRASCRRFSRSNRKDSVRRVILISSSSSRATSRCMRTLTLRSIERYSSFSWKRSTDSPTW